VTALELLSDARHAIGNVDIASKIDGDNGVVSLTLHFADLHGAATTAHRHGREARSALARSESNAARTAPDFAPRITDVPVFFHGTCRTNADPVSRRSSEAQPQHAFEPARDARLKHAAREQDNGVRIGQVLCASRRARPCASGHTSHWRISTMRMTRPARPLQTSGHFQLIRASLITTRGALPDAIPLSPPTSQSAGCCVRIHHSALKRMQHLRHGPPKSGRSMTHPPLLRIPVPSARHLPAMSSRSA